MAISRAKRRKLSHSSDESTSDGVDMDELESRSTPDASPSVSRSNGQSTSKESKTRIPTGKMDGISTSMKRGYGTIPTNDKLMAVSSAGGSSMITLQINDLLREVRLDYDKVDSRLEKTLHRLQQIVQDLPDVGPMTASEAEKSVRKEGGIYVPFPNPKPNKDTRYTFEYRRPEIIEVIGSLPLWLGIKSKDINTVDLAVTLPDSILQEKDFLNHRYFHKRAYYVAQIAAGIKRNAKDDFKLSFEYQQGIPWKPTLIIEPTDSSANGFLQSKCRVRLIFSVSSNIFPESKTLPEKCCLRASEDASPTPFYNACVRSEATVRLYHTLLQTTLSQCDAFRDVCRLGRIWLRQRGFGGSVPRGGFGSFEWSIVCALLLQSGGSKGRPALSPRYSCLQLFKAVVQFLAARDLTDPMFVNGATCEISPSDFPVLFDGAGQINVLFKMTPWSYQLLRQEARSTIEAFSSKVTENFESIFVKRLDEDLLRFDQCILIEAGRIPEKHQQHSPQGTATEYLQTLHTVISRALGNRVKLIHLSHEDSPSWSIKRPLKQKPKDDGMIRLGLLLDAEHVDRLVDHGPSAEDQTAAAEFRRFWGDKAELRRFKDGSITESLVWSEKTPVTRQIILSTLQRHFDLPSNAVSILGHQIEELVTPHDMPLPRKAAFKLVNDAFQSLSNRLRQLEGLPLSIRSILPASSQLRFASLQTPLISTPIHPIDIIIEFEGSARWPDSLPAIQRTKIAFLIKLGDLLSASESTIITRVGLENTSGAASQYCNISFLDIILPSPSPGLTTPIPFRVRIHHDRTLTLLQKTLTTTSLSPHSRAAFTRTLHAQTRHNLTTPLHTTTLSRLCTFHPTLPTSIHLLKTWTASHHLTHSLPPPILELFSTLPYLHPSPYPTAPANPQTALLRTLAFLSTWDWTSDLLLLDLSGTNTELTPLAVSNLRTRFTAWRQTLDPALNNVVWFVGTTIDETGVAWTQGAQPSRVVAARITALARASMELVRRPGAMGMQRVEEEWWGRLFRSPLADFDFLIHCKKGKKKGIAGPGPGAGSTKYKNLQLQAGAAAAAVEEVGFDPTALFLRDLESCFGQHILFFYGVDGGASASASEKSDVIAGLWNPKLLERGRQREWRVRTGYSTIPVPLLQDQEGGEGDEVGGVRGGGEEEEEEEEEVAESGGRGETGRMRVEGVVNQQGILAEIESLGAGIVERVEVIREVVV